MFPLVYQAHGNVYFNSDLEHSVLYINEDMNDLVTHHPFTILQLQKELSIILASRVEDVLNAAFDDGLPTLSSPETDMVSKL